MTGVGGWVGASGGEVKPISPLLLTSQWCGALIVKMADDAALIRPTFLKI
jgi:hypothetical protein